MVNEYEFHDRKTAENAYKRRENPTRSQVCGHMYILSEFKWVTSSPDVKSIAIQLPLVARYFQKVWPSLGSKEYIVYTIHHPFVWHTAPICIAMLLQKYWGQGSLGHSQWFFSQQAVWVLLKVERPGVAIPPTPHRVSHTGRNPSEKSLERVGLGEHSVESCKSPREIGAVSSRSWCTNPWRIESLKCWKASTLGKHGVRDNIARKHREKQGFGVSHAFRKAGANPTSK